MNDWIELPGCQYITATSCTFSLPNLNVFDDIKFRIRAERGNSTSAWHIVDSFIPFLKGKTQSLAEVYGFCSKHCQTTSLSRCIHVRGLGTKISLNLQPPQDMAPFQCFLSSDGSQSMVSPQDPCRVFVKTKLLS